MSNMYVPGHIAAREFTPPRTTTAWAWAWAYEGWGCAMNSTRVTLLCYACTRHAPSRPILAPLAHEGEVHSALLAPLAQRLHQRRAIRRGHPAYPASTMAAAVTEAPQQVATTMAMDKTVMRQVK
eukprot:COSAG01_NODE_12696_length_1698_cov_3.727955_2_plen_125_part_00